MSGLACVARGRRKKGMGRGREKSTKEGKGKGASPFPSLPYPPPFSPFSLSPSPFEACYAGYAFGEISHYFIRSYELVIFRKILAITSSRGGGVGKRFFKGLKIF